MRSVAVLFARADSVYKSLPGCDVWDEARNALDWPGGPPIVAHPPCRMWGRLKRAAKGTAEEKYLAIWAVRQIQRYGGVLEHPNGSSLWKELRLPPPNGLPDSFGGWTLRVAQFHWGHRANKSTLLYIVGCAPADLPVKPKKPGRAAFVITNNHRTPKGSPEFRPEVSRPEREATPPLFAEWLVEVARRCRQPRRMLP